jgi:hypothetical protein
LKKKGKQIKARISRKTGRYKNKGQNEEFIAQKTKETTISSFHLVIYLGGVFFISLSFDLD